MSERYDDSRFGVVKVLTFATVTATNTGAVARIKIPEDMYITEFGLMVSTLLTGDASTVQLSDQSSSAITLLTSTTTQAVGILLTTGALTISLSSGSNLIVTNSVQLIGGVFKPYIKYRQYYS